MSKVELIYDLFHVVAKYGREVINRVRVNQANQLRHDKPASRVIESSRRLLQRNRENLNRHQFGEAGRATGKPTATAHRLPDAR